MLLKPQLWAMEGRNELLGWLTEGTVTCCCFFQWQCQLQLFAKLLTPVMVIHLGLTGIMWYFCWSSSLHSPGAGAGSSTRCWEQQATAQPSVLLSAVTSFRGRRERSNCAGCECGSQPKQRFWRSPGREETRHY